MIIRNFIIVKVDSKYCNFLRSFDNRVAYNYGLKELRPFIGILFKIQNFEYFSPLSSPKPKYIKMKDNIDFIKIKNGELGVINLNNMIPVMPGNYSLLDLDNVPSKSSDLKRYILLTKQLKWLNRNIKDIKNTAFTLYDLYCKDSLPNNVKLRCCDFKLLEEKCILYNLSKNNMGNREEEVSI